ncbi:MULTISPECIES: PhzF family phenazine biosynthesis protein [unclassified Mesorhizobium]|uniref:PhzF family phenazine biosynthesis protein n=1 Tax=unclassified Mesorhizobium TaxID=325217 RepID=UPI001129C726|nr:MULTISPECIES: PhzF family phenazine biosynthesis protein [unclassified Mesorhizobium]TPI52412.1 PhzF family phenazine biosynthesis protein [Mesorhizobium sp. B3-1-1]TPJ66149.1 PhzF family phenazine biosynthesis protein [Mesorhizobium sp. B2-6-7]TPJ84884.1 PhzF family phenazine biosynthesis protein [Mesorhizobium sp. B2-6-3]TPJ99378.1 PhzF family phenazine biosynthesis protein [Mesorhizobium sp. B2-5-10]TPK10793.1 PhzF family phenazine biosynthesis protein [Mesorhizobium sp. B2-5-11]
MRRDYLLYDVFTTDRLAGNPLAVVLDSGGLDTAAMQAIAREFNLSESVFVLPPDNPKHRARIRIFTPDYEMPFAGHPTVGSAIALAELADIALAEMADNDGAASIFVLEENIGPVRCAVSKHDGATFAEFDLAKLPEPLKLEADPVAIGAALGLAPHEIGFENHRVAFWSAGVPYVTIPVANLEAAGRIRLDNQAWSELAPRKSEWAFASPYVYCRETVNHESAFHVRMVVPGTPSYEDPATGSAAAAFAGAVMHFDAPTDGVSQLWIEQGLEMGRPSRIRLELSVQGGKLVSARIGGNAVKVAEGKLFV